MRVSLGITGTLLLTLACLPSEPTEPAVEASGPTSRLLASYFPPPESGGGWRTRDASADVAALGADISRLDALGAYVMSLP